LCSIRAAAKEYGTDGRGVFRKSRDQFTAFTATGRVDGIVVGRRADSGVSVGHRSWEAGKRTNQATSIGQRFILYSYYARATYHLPVMLVVGAACAFG